MEKESFRSAYFHSSGVELFYIEGKPKGLPLLLLHGTGSRWQPFQTILLALAEKYHVFALDFRGHGRSGRTPGAYRLIDYTNDIYQFIIHQIQAPVNIYGHSLGAMVGINLAVEHPGWVRALVLGDPPFFYHDTDIKDTTWHSAFIELLEFQGAHPDPIEMDAWLADNFPGMPPDRRKERVQSLEMLDPEVLRAVISNEIMEGIYFINLPAGVACPVLLLRGEPEFGSALREQDVDFATRAFSRIKVLEMEAVGHGIIPVTQITKLMEFIDAAYQAFQSNQLARQADLPLTPP